LLNSIWDRAKGWPNGKSAFRLTHLQDLVTEGICGAWLPLRLRAAKCRDALAGYLQALSGPEFPREIQKRLRCSKCGAPLLMSFWSLIINWWTGANDISEKPHSSLTTIDIRLSWLCETVSHTKKEHIDIGSI